MIYSALPHLNGNLMAAVDFETTGLYPGYHEPIQIAVVPLDSDFKLLTGVTPFVREIKPLYPERAEKRANDVHKRDLTDLLLYASEPDKVADMLVDWFEALELPLNRCLVPLAHNWPFEHGFLKAWLGHNLTEKLFFGHARDAMQVATYYNDRAMFAGERLPFNSVGLQALCSHFGVRNLNPHDAYCDAMAEADVYCCLCNMEL